MTVDIIIETTHKPSVLIYYKDVAPIGWERVFEIINFNPKLLYDNCPNFWSTSQLEYVVKRLERLRNDSNYFMINECEHSLLLPCIQTLVEQFAKYVEDKCVMTIY